jgi:hypothetical protein
MFELVDEDPDRGYSLLEDGDGGHVGQRGAGHHVGGE